jgi:integrase/recombinase XerD
MTKPNAKNERIKRDYFRLLKDARGYDEASIDAVAASINRFETYTRFKGFEKFHIEQAIGFKRWLADQRNQRTGRPISKATMSSTLRALREFFLWLGGQSGFRSRISFGDTAYFRLSEKDDRIAQISVESPVPTLKQIELTMARMPTATVLQRRNRAVVAFIILTGARDDAVASLRLKHVDLDRQVVFQDPRAVRTKASKAIRTWFFPVGGCAEEIVADWIAELRTDHLWNEEDPLFPATSVAQNEARQFAAVGLRRSAWSNADPIRKLFRQAFETAGLPYFNPHSFRKTLTRLGEQVCLTPEEFKSWSQNLGHEQVLTTFSSYGSVPLHRQGEIILSLGVRGLDDRSEDLAGLLERAAMQLKTRAA